MIYAHALAHALATILGRTFTFLLLLGVLALSNGVPPGLDLTSWALLYLCFYGLCTITEDLMKPFWRAFKATRTQGDNQ
ncbi:hypothetical protein P7F88_25415 [Vibrio hannami]|uniref:hypothetical protein n=1 Tax=Vibrio hannami TaxID=2717094 RepID=UPI00240EEF84|nr:hypothetical protein [Vibrio hannami]MDG3089205.1 hypothetical protein [Vibrio hannami]